MSGLPGKETVETVHAALEAPFGETRELPKVARLVDSRAAASPQAPSSSVLSRGSAIGRFVVLDVLGTGSVGVVYKAYDPRLGREVALKSLQSHALGKRAETRLLDEARSMAKISHPNVVTLHEVALEAEQVILAMEYVAGCTLWQWNRQQPRSWRAVVAAYLEAGNGLAAAHRAGLVHRDFKPANVLVGDDGRIRVTDFGIATNLAELDSTPDPKRRIRMAGIGYTRADGLVGTPWYMAPEQHCGGVVDERCDQYAFCLALWEALCGASPFPGKNAAELEEMKSKGPPPWPKHVPVASRVAEALRRGLSPDPEARFANMEALLERLAVDSAPWRRRWLAATTLAPVLALSSGAVWAWHAEQAQRCSGADEHLQSIWNSERRAQVVQAFSQTRVPYAPQTGRRVLEVIDAYGAAWANQFTQTCEATAIRAEQSQTTMDLRMACLHRSKLELHATISVLTEADPQVVEHASKMVAELPALERCGDLQAISDAVVSPESPEDSPVVDDVRAALADAATLRRAAKYDDALARVTHAQAALGDLDHPSLTAEIAHLRGELEGDLGRYVEAEVSLRKALRLAVRSGELSLASKIASSLASSLASWLQRPAEGQWLAEIALDLALERDDELAQAEALANLALVLNRRGNYAQSEAESRRALVLWERNLGADHFSSVYTRNNLAIVLREQGRYAEAEEELRRVLAIRERTMGPHHPLVGHSHNNLGIAMAQRGRGEDAVAAFRRAIAIYERSLPANHPERARALANLANALIILKRFTEAEETLRSALATAYEAPEQHRAALDHLHGNLAVSLLGQERYADADEYLHRVLASMEESHGPEHPDVANTLGNIGLSALRQHAYPEAAKVLRRALAIRENTLAPDHPMLANARMHLAKALTELEHHEEARGLLELAWESIAKAPVRPEKRAEIAFALAMALQFAQRDHARAVELAEAASAAYREAGTAWKAELAAVEQWLGRELRTRTHEMRP